MNQIIEMLSSKVHDAWWNEKKIQGFHAPMECANVDYSTAISKFTNHCDKCHTDMYPYDQLPENIKEYDRVTVRTVLNALGECTKQ